MRARKMLTMVPIKPGATEIRANQRNDAKMVIFYFRVFFFGKHLLAPRDLNCGMFWRVQQLKLRINRSLLNVSVGISQVMQVPRSICTRTRTRSQQFLPFFIRMCAQMSAVCACQMPRFSSFRLHQQFHHFQTFTDTFSASQIQFFGILPSSAPPCTRIYHISQIARYPSVSIHPLSFSAFTQ